MQAYISGNPHCHLVYGTSGHTQRTSARPDGYPVAQSCPLPLYSIGYYAVVSSKGSMVAVLHAQVKLAHGVPHVGAVPGAVAQSAAGVGRAPSPTLPTDEGTLLIWDHTVLQHPRVAVSSTRFPPQLQVPVQKRKKKFQNAAELAERYENHHTRISTAGVAHHVPRWIIRKPANYCLDSRSP